MHRAAVSERVTRVETGAYCLGQFHKIQPFWGGELGHEIRLDSLFGMVALLEN